MDQKVWLFSYGTLRQPAVQRSLFGREVRAENDCLAGYDLTEITISNPRVVAISGSARHPALAPAPTGSKVDGAALHLTLDDLAIADGYEANEYHRQQVRLVSGRLAYAYFLNADERTEARHRNFGP